MSHICGHKLNVEKDHAACRPISVLGPPNISVSWGTSLTEWGLCYPPFFTRLVKFFYPGPSFSLSQHSLSMCRASEKRDMSMECYAQKHTCVSDMSMDWACAEELYWMRKDSG